MLVNAHRLPQYTCGIVELVGWSIMALVIKAQYDRRLRVAMDCNSNVSTVELFLCVVA